MTYQTQAIEFLCHEFCTAFSAVFEQTVGTPYGLNVSNLGQSAGTETLGYALQFGGKFSGVVTVQVDMHSAAVLATTLIGGAGDESVSYLPEHEDALFEIVSQTAGGMATALRERFGTCEISVERRSDAAVSAPVTILLKAASEVDTVSISLLTDEGFLDSVGACLSGTVASSTASDSSPHPAEGASSESHNLQLIMDVELDLTLRFGQRVLALSEVADLTTGSVVELDRVVDEPVELLLGERVIARGDVVIVDGNYGLRITELTSIDRNHFLTA